MKRFEKKLDNYYTKKLIGKIRDKLCMFCVDLIIDEGKDMTGKEKIYISINLQGKNELKKPRNVIQFSKDKSVILLYDNSFYETVRKSIEIELEMISKGL